MTYKKPIPFDLTRALAGDKVVTENGKEVTGFRYCDRPIRAYVNERYSEVSLDGNLYDFQKGTVIKLLMVPKIKTYWVNVFYNNSGEPVVSQFLHDEESQARLASRDPSYIKTISFEIEQ